MSGARTRRATLADLDAIARIERAAGALYAPYGLGARLEEAGTERAALEAAIGEGLAWIAEDPLDGQVGFALASVEGDDLHLDELDVSPTHQRRGLGSSLLAAVIEEGRARGCARLTLITVAFTPWTVGFYAHHRFEALRWDAIDPPLARRTGLAGEPRPPEARTFEGCVVLARALR